jgi:two-component system OmpR family response regulator/two-component system alkaline phosphatase synthesis response regulator PhoP
MPDLVVLDIMLPGLSGVEILEAIRETPNGQAVPIVIATASTLSEDDLNGFHISAFLRKPILPTMLVSTVREFVPDDDQ